MDASLRDARAEKRSESAERLIRADAAQIFSVLTDIRHHATFDGSGMVRGEARGPERLVLGSQFSVGMEQHRLRYRSVSTVVEFVQDELICWETAVRLRGRTVLGGQRWRYELMPRPGGTLVRHSYLWGYATMRWLTIQLPGFPEQMQTAMVHSLAALEREVISRPAS